MRESRIAARLELERRTAEYQAEGGEIHKDNSRTPMICVHCGCRKLLNTRYLGCFGVACSKCGGRLRLA